jgi:O-acetyl-ADP-ribose deacetylase (regulator of RNase III)
VLLKKHLLMAEIKLKKGDITKMKVDAVVNAANSSLMGGGGVDGAIHRAGGPAILAECKEIRATQGKLPAGEAVLTTAGEMPAGKVIHTVGPVWNEGKVEENDHLLANCYRNSLKLALENDLTTVAFPNISTGVYGYPKDRAADVAIGAVREFLEKHGGIETVFFVCFDEENYQIYQERLSE